MSHALVALAPATPQEAITRRTVRSANADFVAHLIATSEQAPQTCARRRAAPDEARTAYTALDTRQPVGRSLSRSL